jgi:glucosamine-6-phosphate deaminase
MNTSRLVPVILPNPGDVGHHVAASIARAVDAAVGRGDTFVLGCPSGRSPAPVLAHLAREVAVRDLDLRGLRVVMMDEYVVPDGAGGFAAVDPEEPHSCRGFALREIVAPLNRAARPGRGLDAAQVWIADPADPSAFEDVLTRLGGIDLFLLATGASDGHVAFNPPGSAHDSRTRIIELAQTTRADNVNTFPAFGSLDRVPTHGITVGVGTILGHSRRAVMVAHGPDKARSVDRIVHAAGYDPAWPATVVVECREPSLILDQAAAARLPLAS